MSLPDDQGLTQAAPNATLAATAILHAALGLGIKVGSDGDEIVALMPLCLSRDVRRWFEIWLNNFRDEVIAVIQAQNPGGRA